MQYFTYWGLILLPLCPIPSFFPLLSTLSLLYVCLASHFEGFPQLSGYPWLSSPIHGIKKLNGSSLFGSILLSLSCIWYSWIQNPQPPHSWRKKCPVSWRGKKWFAKDSITSYKTFNDHLLLISSLTLVFPDFLLLSVEFFWRFCWINLLACLCRQSRVYLPPLG